MILSSIYFSQQSTECQSVADCGEGEGCLSNICVDLCSDGVCGKNANCEVRNGVVICSCEEGFAWVAPECGKIKENSH